MTTPNVPEPTPVPNAVNAAFPPPAPYPGEPAAKRPWFKKKRILIPGAALALIVAIGAAGAAGGNRADTAADPVVAESAAEVAEATVPETVGLTAKEAAALIENAGLVVDFSADSGVVLDRDNWTVLSTTPSAAAVVKSGDTVVVNVEKKAAAVAPAAPEEPAEPAAPAAPSLEHTNALGSAKSYLALAGFSRFGLIRQLSSEYGEGYPEDVATWAADNAGADWNAEAAESAQSYLDMTSFSRQGLFDQLTSQYGEQFTADEANFALAAVGY